MQYQTKFHYEVPLSQEEVEDIERCCGVKTCRNVVLPFVKNKDAKRGMVIAEYAPHTRTLISFEGSPYSAPPKYHFKKLPYLIHVISYYKNNNGYLYTGLYGGSLRVYTNNVPLKSFNDELFICPTDFNMDGFSCLPHEYDFTVYPSLDKLVNCVSSLWFTTPHYDIDIRPLGHKHSLLNLINIFHADPYTNLKSGYLDKMNLPLDIEQISGGIIP
jgi:hypothetical protein